MSTVTQSVPSFFSSALEHLEAPVIAVRDFVTPPFKFVADKVQQIWTFLQPYMESAGKFLTSRVGISLELLGLSILPLYLSRTVENKALSIACLAAGILMAGAGGFILCSSGIMPSFITNLIPAAAV